MSLRELTAADLSTLEWNDAGEGWHRIVADVTCARCGAYQAADSDPVTDQASATTLCVRLFNQVGWRLGRVGELLCPDCAKRS